MPRKRLEGETLEEYRESIRAESLVDKIRTGGRWIWNASKHGTFQRVKKIKNLSMKARDYKGGADV